MLIDGVNLYKKTVKPTQENPSGGITDKELPIDISNVSLLSPKTKKATRVRIEERDGKKVRVATKCGSVLD
jgi:large subunit ribosomal protein L24